LFNVNRIVIAVIIAFVVLSAINFWYYRHNVHLIVETMALVATDSPTAEESAAADQVAQIEGGTTAVRMTLPWEREWFIGREIAIVAVLGGALVFASRRAKVIG
jgi:hypothetical protein